MEAEYFSDTIKADTEVILALRKHVYPNILKISPNEYSQSMFLSRNKKNNVYPCKPQFYYIKVGFKGVKIIQACFRDASSVT